jgi:hypothetical protein
MQGNHCNLPHERISSSKYSFCSEFMIRAEFFFVNVQVSCAFFSLGEIDEYEPNDARTNEVSLLDTLKARRILQAH